MTLTVHGDFLSELFLSIRLISALSFYIKFGTKNATWEHAHFMMLHPINLLDISNQAKQIITSNKD